MKVVAMTEVTEREHRAARRRLRTRRATIIRGSYLTAVVLWLCFNLLFPVWQGTLYNYHDREGRWYAGGRFGITDRGTFSTTAPLWRPPRPSGGSPSTVRFPMSPVSGRKHIEIATASCFWRFTVGVMLAGFAAGVSYWITSRRQPTGRRDRVITVAVAVSLSLLTANIVLFVLGAVSLGFALIDPVVWGVLGIGIGAGLGLGLFVEPERSTVPPVPLKRDVVAEDANEPKRPTGNSETEPEEHVQSKNNSQLKEMPTAGKFRRMRRLTWWWRVPAYLIAQFFVISCIRSLDWPTGHDVFGPYKKIPEWVYLAFWGQFIIVPFLSWRCIGFLLSELAIAGIVSTSVRWARTDNVFRPAILVPDWVWVLYWLQFILVAIVVWKVPRFIRSKIARPSS